MFSVAAWFHLIVESENCVKCALTDIDLRQQEGTLLTKCSAIDSYQLFRHLYYLFNMLRLPTQFPRKICWFVSVVRSENATVKIT